ncbi:MAG: heavy metal-binding domain-containing protein [Planctomycetota bacterium]
MLLFGIPALLAVLPAVGCRQTQPTPAEYPPTGFTARPSADIYPPPGGAPPAADQWVCPMHPTFQLSYPGKCSICGMDLVRSSELSGARESSSGSEHSHSSGSGDSHSSGSGCGHCG